jgi:hypothetical protein
MSAVQQITLLALIVNVIPAIITNIATTIEKTYAMGPKTFTTVGKRSHIGRISNTVATIRRPIIMINVFVAKVKTAFM